MNLFGVDLREGWAGNLTAELVGVVLGLLVAYVVADRVVRWRLRQEQRPLQRRLASKLHSELRMMTVSWGLRLGIWKPGELANDSPGLETRVEAELARYRSPEEMQELIGRLEQHNASGLAQLAEEIAESIRGVTHAADRYSNIVADDPVLHGLIGDLEEVASALQSTVRALPSLQRFGVDDAGKLGLAGLCRAAFKHACKTRAHVGDSR